MDRIIVCWLLLFLLPASISFLLPHSARRPYYFGHKRRGNSFWTLQQCIEQLRTYDHVSRSDISLLSEGLEEDFIRAFIPESIAAYNESEQIVQLYSLTNGVNYEDGHHELQHLWLFPNYYMLSLPEAFELYINFPRSEVNEYIDEEKRNVYKYNVLFDYFKITWFPIMSSGVGSYILIDVQDGGIFEYSPFEDLHNRQGEVIQHDGILQLFQSILIDFQSNQYGLNEDFVVVERYDAVANTDDQDNFGALFKTAHNLNLFEADEESSGNPELQNTKKGLNFQEFMEKIKTHADRHLRKLFNRFGIPLLHFNCKLISELCDQIKSVVIEHHRFRNLCKITNRSIVKENTRKFCGKTKKHKGLDCFPFPFVSTSVFNLKNHTSILVPAKEVSLIGSQLNLFYSATRQVGFQYRNACFKITNFE